MKNTYTIPEVERENIQKVVSRFQKKAAAYGKSLNVQFGEAYATERKIYENRQDWETGATTLVFVRTELVEVLTSQSTAKLSARMAIPWLPRLSISAAAIL